MIPHSFTSEGFILNRRNFGEADRILHIYSKDNGKIIVIAKGVRRTDSRKRGHIEIFSKINFQIVNGKGMGILTEAEMIESYSNIRKSIKKVSLAYYFMEVIDKITHENEENTELFNIILAAMENLKSENKLKELRKKFVIDVLKSLGYWPKGEELMYPDEKLEEIIERQMYSQRVGKKVLSIVE